MIEVKYHKGNSKVHEVSREDFVKATNELAPYMVVDKNGKNAYAICPLCENPVKLIGIYVDMEKRKQREHARHCKYNVANISDFVIEKYERCPYHRKNPDYIMEPRRPEDMTQLNKDILQSAHDHFGECLYIISKITGLYISNNLAEKIATDYMAHPGYMTYDVTRENIPYIMGCCLTGIYIRGRVIMENSPLYNMLKNVDGIHLERLESRENSNSKIVKYRINEIPYKGLIFHLMNYKFEANTTEKLKEYITINISIPDGEGTFDTFMSQEIELDPYFFNKLINKGNWKANGEIQKIADKVLVLRHR